MSISDNRKSISIYYSLIDIGYPGDVIDKKRIFNEDKIHFDKW